MFDKVRAKLGLALAAKAVYDSIGDDKMTPDKKYSLAIGFKKAATTFMKQFASCTAVAAYLDGVVLPTTWEEFQAKWMTLAIPIVWGLIKVVMNAYKQGAFSAKSAASVLLIVGLGASNTGCASLNSMSAADKAALMSAAVASVTAAGVQVSAAIDAHKQAQLQRDIDAATAEIEQAQRKLDVAVGVADAVRDIATKPPAANATP